MLLLRWRKLTIHVTVFRRQNSRFKNDFRKLGSVAMLQSLIRILRGSLVQTDTEVADKYAKHQQPAVCVKFAFGRYAAGCVSALMGLVTLTFNIETGVLVASKVGNLHSESGHARPSGSQVIRYVRLRAGRKGRTKPTTYGRGHNKCITIDTISPPLAVRCCRVANDLTNFTGDRQTNRQTYRKDIA